MSTAQQLHHDVTVVTLHFVSLLLASGTPLPPAAHFNVSVGEAVLYCAINNTVTMKRSILSVYYSVVIIMFTNIIQSVNEQTHSGVIH